MHHTTFYLLIPTVQIRQSCNIQRLFSICTNVNLNAISFLKIVYWHLIKGNSFFFSIIKIQSAANALRNMRGLPWPKDHKPKLNEDILDWLQAMFGFQVAHLYSTALLNLAHFRVKCMSIMVSLKSHAFFFTLQKDNVANQREHLILLLANVHIRNLQRPEQQFKVNSFFLFIFLVYLQRVATVG